MSPSGPTRIWWDNDLGAYRMTTPYSTQFLDLFKALMPGSDRAWNATSKTWSFTEKYLPAVEALVEKIFGQKPTVITKAQAQKAQTPPSVTTSPIDKIIVEFVRLLPREAMQKAYRHAAVVLHPDHGGDMEKMARINAAWTRLEKELYSNGN